MSPSILFPFVVVMAIGLYHVTSVQSAAIPDIVASLIRRSSLGNGQWRRVVNPAENGHERKSVTFEEENEDEDEEGEQLDRDYLEEAKRGLPERVRSPASSAFRGDLRDLIRKKSGPVVSKGENLLELKDRDYFEAIGIAPPSYQYHHSSHQWEDD